MQALWGNYRAKPRIGIGTQKIENIEFKNATTEYHQITKSSKKNRKKKKKRNYKTAIKLLTKWQELHTYQ